MLSMKLIYIKLHKLMKFRQRDDEHQEGGHPTRLFL